MDGYALLRCHQNGTSTPLRHEGNTLHCPDGTTYPIVNNIPRFVPPENYASAFGKQWNVYRHHQLDTYIGVPISEERLTRIAGGSLDIFKDKLVLEAGCGAGRFTEILLKAGANVFGVDLSNAVEANYANHHTYANLFLCQADILNIPVEHNSFDIVMCIGVIQHTPNPEATIEALTKYLKPGGLLLIDHYRYTVDEMPPSRKRLRPFLLNKSPEFTIWFTKTITHLFWPLHRLLYPLRKNKWLYKFDGYFRGRISPLADYQDEYPQLSKRLLKEWAMLDTHDMLTAYYHFARSTEQIAGTLRELGMVQVETEYAGNGVEARARKPLSE